MFTDPYVWYVIESWVLAEQNYPRAQICATDIAAKESAAQEKSTDKKKSRPMPLMFSRLRNMLTLKHLVLRERRMSL